MEIASSPYPGLCAKPMKTATHMGVVFATALFGAIFSDLSAQAPTADPLPSWNDGAAKKAIIEFVAATTTAGSPKLVPPAERVAAFDQDGTLWVEQPIYSQVMYCLDRVPALVKAKPELAKVEPFKTVMSGDRAAIAKLPTDQLLKLCAAALSRMTIEQFRGEVRDWIVT